MAKITYGAEGGGNGEQATVDTTQETKSESMVYLPKAIMDAGAKEGDDFEGTISGKIVARNGMLYIQPETVNGESVEMETENEGGEETADESLTAFMEQAKGAGAQ